MIRFPRLSFAAVCAVILISDLTACQSENPSTTAPAPATPSGPLTLPADTAHAVADAQFPSAGVGDFRIVAVLLGKSVDADRTVITDTEVFKRSDAIHASVLSAGASQGLRLTARWLAPDGAVIAETSQPLVPVAGTSTTFSISNPQGWPPGAYQLLIGVNGKTQRTREFRIQ